jgi:diguanylate cyclase (GGDEF)-like protein
MTSLQEQAGVLLQRWKVEMQRLPLPAHIQVVEGDARVNMERIARSILESTENEEAVESFKPDGEAYKSAQELGRIRRQQSFSIEELVQEHVILRNEFWNLLREQMDMMHVVDFHLEKRLNGCFDALLQAAAAAYHYDFSREIMENPLRDELTGLYNKSYFHGRLIEELRRSVRYDHDISLVIFEIGNYYQVQELEGEEKIRELLKSIAASLSRMTRDCDVVARLAEGSFTVLLPETGWRGGKIMAERLCKYYLRELPSLVSEESIPELHWGLASFPEEVRLPEKLYACAVEAMRSSRSLSSEEVAIYRSSETREGV